MSAGRWGRGKRKMGFDGVGAPSRKAVSDRMTVGGVDFVHNRVTGWTCSVCRVFTDLGGMIGHAKVHQPAEVARAFALTQLTVALEQLDAAALELVVEVLPAVVANPVGFRVVVQALTSGERKHPGRGLGPSPDQHVAQHVAALGRHGEKACDLYRAVAPLALDADTGLPHAGLAAARGVLAIQRASQEPG
jgi:hypothetical protein